MYSSDPHMPKNKLAWTKHKEEREKDTFTVIGSLFCFVLKRTGIKQGQSYTKIDKILRFKIYRKSSCFWIPYPFCLCIGHCQCKRCASKLRAV